MCALTINMIWGARLLLQFRWSRGAVISLWPLEAMWAQEGRWQGNWCHRDWSARLQRTPATMPARLGDQMESDPAMSARHEEGRGATVSPPRMLSCLLSREISCCSQLFASCFFWRIAPDGFACVAKVEGLLFSAAAPHSEDDSRAGWCRGGDERPGSRTHTLLAFLLRLWEV